ncbi:unnamed protein product [Acanthoscelides obtectus]|uniref:Uncharacterized protein n=1 Tax=Acanthoscelides obtectus TaxID=200917 RepID=A0A9P0KJQ1_ACAOB|nr:unnamed protein product [Acanthoscelides obtectus]CAK1669238.1 hypothetical protein AOBTE_LOCUS26891 [Acanthoscelides obtectus]
MKFYEIRVFAARFQAKASKNVHDFHTFEEIQGHIWETNIMTPKVIFLHALEDDCRLIHAERASIELIIEMMKRLRTVACWRFSIVQMNPELRNDLIFLHLIELILAVAVEVF